MICIWRLGQSIFPFVQRGKNDKNQQTNPDMVPYSHNPPGHTCGLPCCNKDLQIHLNKQKKTHRSCIGIQEYDVLAQNFTFKGKLKKVPGLESGFFSVQEVKDTERAAIPEFGSIRGKMSMIKEEKNFNFMKGREITLPEVSNTNTTEKLYLEDFNFGESDDFQNIEIFVDDESKEMRVDKLEYYKRKISSGSAKGVPYDPKQLENAKLFPWGIPMDHTRDKDTNQKDDSSVSNYYSSGSNYYETLQDPEEEKSHEDTDDIPEKSDSGIDEERTNSPDIEKRISQKVSPTLPSLPPKLPVQNQFNHPPLSKSGISISRNHDETNLSPTNELLSDTDSSSCTQYNTYSSVCSISNFANQMSKQAYERYLSLDRDILSQKPAKRDIRELSYTGDDMPITAKNIELAASKTKMALTKARNKRILENKKNQSNVMKATDKESLMKDALVDNEMDDDDEEGGTLNHGFKSIKLVDGKILGSRYSLDRVNSFGDELHDRFLHLHVCDSSDRGIENEDEKKVMELLKKRLRDVDKLEESPSGESFNDNPITLIL